MDLNNLRLFVAVYQAESFSKAAEQLAMPVATVSRRIAEFEKSLSTQLFDRYKTGVKPTALGLQLYEKVYLSLDNLTQVTQDFIGEQQELAVICVFPPFPPVSRFGRQLLNFRLNIRR